ncbi:hypothetical protein B14911_13092 [Bacillus sp. NRRL B-14911]|nr:hypothetical protein B14911_13092 [Bacillus sp. NRRL B-14911]
MRNNLKNQPGRLIFPFQVKQNEKIQKKKIYRT